MSYFLGIDPGKTGALALVEGDDLLRLEDMPSTPADLSKLMLLLDAYRPGTPPTAILEHSQPMPRQGVSSSFNYGAHYGTLIGILVAYEMPYREVRSSVWKRKLGLTADKDATRARAQALWPKAELHLKKHHGRAEALLLCEFARREYGDIGA